MPVLKESAKAVRGLSPKGKDIVLKGIDSNVLDSVKPYIPDSQEFSFTDGNGERGSAMLSEIEFLRVGSRGDA